MPLSLTAQAKLKAKDIFHRITLNRITTVVFIFTFIQCFSQALIHSFLFTVDVRYFNLLNGISEVANASAVSGNFTYPPSTTGQVTLRMCNDVDLYHPMANCSVVFDPARDIVPPANLNISFDSGFRGQTILAIMGGEGGMLNRVEASDKTTSENANAKPKNSTTFNDRLYAVRITAADQREVVIGQQCVQILSYPKQHMQNAEREDLTWVFFQFWVFALTFCGLIWDSVPHLAAVICARTVNAAWSVYTIWRTLHQKSVFGQIVEQSGTPCSIEMFKQYFDQRFGFVVADAVLSMLSLAFGAYFSWHLIKVINNQAFRTVGAPEHVMKIYKFFHGLQVCLQLEVFVIAAALGLWADQWFNSYIGSLSEHTTTYAAGFVAMAILLFPWLIVGWTAIRREMKKTTIFFLVISFILLFGWTVMFYSQLYRWTFLQWPYIGCFTTASIILLVLSSTLGIICWRHYGEGLTQYLNAESALQSSNFTADRFEHDVEKSESYDPEAIVYELQRKVSASSTKSSRLSIGSFSAGVVPPMQPEPTFSLPTLARNAPVATFQNVPLVDDPNRLAPLRRGSAF